MSGSYSSINESACETESQVRPQLRIVQGLYSAKIGHQAIINRQNFYPSSEGNKSKALSTDEIERACSSSVTGCSECYELPSPAILL